MARAGRPCSEPGCFRLSPCPAHPGREIHRFDVRATPKRRPPSSAVRRFVMSRDGGVCHLCLRPGADAIDHVVAGALGGSDEPGNLRAAHASCNARKAGAEAAESRRRRSLEGSRDGG